MIVAAPPGVARQLHTAPDLLALAADPSLRQAAVVTVQGWRLLVANPARVLTSLAQIDEFAATVRWRAPVRSPLPPLPLAVGFIADDVSAGLLGLSGDPRPAVAPVPAVSFGVHDWFVGVDPDGRGWVVSTSGDGDALARWAADAPAASPSPPAPRVATAGLSRRAHADAVGQILEWIAAGDLYQANLTFQVTTPWRDSGWELARRLQAATPNSTHAGVLSVDATTALVSVSPETFLRISGDVVTTRPIKGTRPRSADPAADAVAAAQLRDSAKDHAEHVMIVDLERNDLGRVCEAGSVVVPSYAHLEAHPTVWHLTSTVQGRLRPDVGLLDVLAATFPPGSVTGTPKRMAVARTARLEPVRRGVYCGAIGVVATGLVDLSVAIRTAVVAGGQASYGTGGGIVADSDAADEYDEALAKAAAFLRATNATLQ